MSIIKDLNDGVNNLVKLLTDALVPSSKKTTSSEESRNKLQNMNKSDKSSSAVKSVASSIANAINNAQSSSKSNTASGANELINSGSKSTDKQLEDALTSGINGKTYLPSIKTPTYQDLVKQTPDTLKSNVASKINTTEQSNTGYTQKQLEDALISGINGKSYTPVSNTKRTTYKDLVRDTENISNANNKSSFDFYSNLENIAEQLSSNKNFSTALNKKIFSPYFKEYIERQNVLDFEGNNKYNNKENSNTDEKETDDSRTTTGEILFKLLETYGLSKEAQYDNLIKSKFLFHTPKYKINLAYEKNKQNDIKNEIIKNQEEITDLYYYNHPLSYNGCSMIAVNNALVLMGCETSMADIIKTFQENEVAVGNNLLGGIWGSNPYTLTKVFDEYNIEYERVTSDELTEDGIYIIAYWNGMEYSDSAHFVTVEVKNGYTTTYNQKTGTDFRKPSAYLKEKPYITGYRLKLK